MQKRPLLKKIGDYNMNNNEITPIRYNYATDVNEHTRNRLKNNRTTNTRLPFCSLEISPRTLSRDDAEMFHVVDAIRQKNARYKNVLRLRIITNTNRGVNVTIPCDDILHQKYLDLRHLIRNNDAVYVKFPKIYVQGSKFHYELMLIAYDFKIINYE